eukprot:g5325.t1
MGNANKKSLAPPGYLASVLPFLNPGDGVVEFEAFLRGHAEKHREVAQILANRSSEEEFAKIAVVDLGGFRILHLLTTSDDPKVIACSLHAIGNVAACAIALGDREIASNNPAAAVLRKAGCAAIIVPFLGKSETGTEWTRNRAARAVANLAAVDNDEKYILSKHGAVELLLEQLEDLPEKHRAEAIGALSNLAMDAAVEEEIGEKGGIPILLECSSSNDERVARHSLRALRNLSHSERNREIFRSVQGPIFDDEASNTFTDSSEEDDDDDDDDHNVGDEWARVEVEKEKEMGGNDRRQQLPGHDGSRDDPPAAADSGVGIVGNATLAPPPLQSDSERSNVPLMPPPLGKAAQEPIAPPLSPPPSYTEGPIAPVPQMIRPPEEAPPGSLSGHALEAFTAFNDARKNPAAYAIKLRSLAGNFQQKILRMRWGSVVTKEGAGAYEEGASYLESLSPMMNAHYHEKLTVAAQQHASDIARSGLTGHTGSDGSGARDRARRSGFDVDGASLAELIEYGPWRDGAHFISSLIADDGKALRPHRSVMFLQDVKHIGIAVNDHPKFGRVMVMLIAR